MSFQGADQLFANLADLQKNLGKAVADALVTGGKLVEGEAKKSIQSRSGGGVVTRYRNGGGAYEHVKSKPGDAPNTDTGRLVGSITTEVSKGAVFVGTSVDYGKHLEFGTMHIDPRPWLHPAMQERKAEVQKLIAQAVDKEVRKHNVSGV